MITHIEAGFVFYQDDFYNEEAKPAQTIAKILTSVRHNKKQLCNYMTTESAQLGKIIAMPISQLTGLISQPTSCNWPLLINPFTPKITKVIPLTDTIHFFVGYSREFGVKLI